MLTVAVLLWEHTLAELHSVGEFGLSHYQIYLNLIKFLLKIMNE